MDIISKAIFEQDELLFSNIAKKYISFANFLLSEYASAHNFNSIVKEYHSNTIELKEEINKALVNRKMYILHILKEFRSIK
jgi:hypothetical protein